MSTRSKTPSKLSVWFRGVRESFPLVLAATPFGIVFGALGHAQGLPDWVVIGISIIVFAGASQFIAITLLASGAALPVIVLTVFVVNLRHMLYAISLIPFVKKLSHRTRLAMAFALTDETFAVAFHRAVVTPEDKHFVQYYAGSATYMYLNWVVCTWLGIVAGNRIPELTEFGLDVAMVVAFVGIVVPQLKLPSHWCCAIVAGVCGVLTYDWPHQSGLLFSALAAIAVGVVSENVSARKSMAQSKIENEGPDR